MSLFAIPHNHSLCNVLTRPFLAVVLLFLVSPGWSQENTSDTILEEIIVTAQKREQSSQKVPVSVFALSGDALRQTGIDTVESLRDIAAGVEVVSVTPGAVQMNVRGVTNLAVGQLDVTAAVGYYIDETPLSSFSPSELPDVALWDVERVEVLRGPQGTLFGESSMGGTIRVITRKPDPSSVHGSVAASYESITDGGTGWGLRGTFNAPLIDDELAIRVNVSRTDRDGWIDVPDIGAADANALQQTRARVALGWTPSDRLDLQFSLLDQETNTDNHFMATSRGSYDPQSLGPPGFIAPTQALSPTENRFQLANLTVSYDFDRATLISATSYFDLERFDFGEISWATTPLVGAPGFAYNNLDFPVQSFVQEFRLSSSDDGRLSWTAGAFFKKHERGGYQEILADIPAFMLTDVSRQEFDVEIDSYALFGEIGYQLTDRWALQLGGRYYSDDRRVYNVQVTNSVIFGEVAGTFIDERGSVDDFAPSVGLSWTSERNLHYLRVAKGFRAGGINDNISFAPNEIELLYDPEELWSYEIGTKNRLWSDRLQLNAYLYFNQWNDIQFTQTESSGLFFYTRNAGKAEALGAEFEFIVQATDYLTLGANVSVIDSEITESAPDGVGTIVIPVGNEIPLTPKSTFSLSVDYARPAFADMDGIASARYSYRAANYSSPQNLPNTRNSDSNQVFLRLGLQGESLGVYASVSNLLDEHDTVFKNTALTPLVAFNTYVPPRTWRLEVNWEY